MAYVSAQLRTSTAGKSWYDLPAPAEADLPRLHREVEALRLKNQLDPKRFYKKDEGEGKGIKGLPKFFAVRSFFQLRNLYVLVLIKFCFMSIDRHNRRRVHAVRNSELRKPQSRAEEADACR